ncbi:hypothetical protein JW879_05815 [candidate division WOR-3 bacterium]|nr:hypothetical protein [candidate division WOR-3 bacterium]
MKRFVLLLVLLLLGGLVLTGCKGDKKAGETSARKEAAAKEEEENLYLTEQEVKSFIEAYPVFVEIIKRTEQEVKPLADKQSPLSGMQFAEEFKEYAEELEGSLGKYGFTLESFGATYSKILGAIVYSQMESATGGMMKKMLDNPNLSEEQKEEIRKNLKETEESEEMKASKENWKIVEKHMSEIEKLFKGE